MVEKYGLRRKLSPKTSAARAEELRDAPTLLPNLTVTRPPNTYLLEIRYRSKDRRLAAEVTNAIADSYLNHLFRIRTDSSGRIGAWMTDQLAQLKSKMEASSQRLAGFERELSVINPDQKTSIQSASLLQLNTQYNAAKDERVRKEAAYNAIQASTLNAAWASTQGIR